MPAILIAIAIVVTWLAVSRIRLPESICAFMQRAIRECGWYCVRGQVYPLQDKNPAIRGGGAGPPPWVFRLAMSAGVPRLLG